RAMPIWHLSAQRKRTCPPPCGARLAHARALKLDLRASISTPASPARRCAPCLTVEALASLREAWRFYRRPPDLLEPLSAPAGRLVVVISVGVLLVVVLVVILRHPERLGGQALRGPYFPENASRVPALPFSPRGPRLPGGAGRGARPGGSAPR